VAHGASFAGRTSRSRGSSTRVTGESRSPRRCLRRAEHPRRKPLRVSLSIPAASFANVVVVLHPTRSPAAASGAECVLVSQSRSRAASSRRDSGLMPSTAAVRADPRRSPAACASRATGVPGFVSQGAMQPSPRHGCECARTNGRRAASDGSAILQEPAHAV
jgi:hypothetical protein